MKISATLVLSMVMLCAFSQSIDSIKKLNEKAQEFISINKDSAYFYSELSYKLNNHRFPVEEAFAKLYAGLCYKRFEKYDTAYSLFNAARTEFEKHGMLKEVGRSYWYIGKVWHELYQFDRAVPYYLKAFEKLKAAEDFETQVKVLNGLGYMEILQGNDSKGLEWFKKCLDIVHKNDLHEMAFRLYNNIAIIYRRNQDYDLALEYFKKALAYDEKEIAKYHFIITMGNIGETFESLNNRDSARYYYQTALNFAQETEMLPEYINEANLKLALFEGNQYKSLEVLKQLVKSKHGGRKSIFLKQLTLAYKEHNIDSAIYYGLLAYDFSVQHNSNIDAKDMSAILGELYEAQSDFKKALSFKKKHQAHSDSITAENDIKKSRDLMVSLETIEAANKIDTLQSELELKRLKEISVIKSVMIFVIIVGAAVFLVFSRQRARRLKMVIKMQKQEAKLDKRNRELQMQALLMVRYTNQMVEVENGLRNLSSDANGLGTEIRRLLNIIKINRNMDKEWKKFDSYFSDVHKGFIDQLTVIFPSLTVKDIRLCSLLRLKLSNQEVAAIMNIEAKSISMAKYRLRKKMNIPKEVDLVTFLQKNSTL